MVIKRVLLGNEAIARGLLEAGCQILTSYPGTPATEVLSAFKAFAEEEKIHVYVEWSINEKVAYEVALAAAMLGKRAAVAMKQVGVNVASDPLLSSIYTGTKGGFLLIAADDPGPHSSQTEQDSRLWGLLAKIPVLDPCDPQEAKEMAVYGIELSERFEIPVMLRPTLRVCHARQSVTLGPISHSRREASFEKNPSRWAATPAERYQLHKLLNLKAEEIVKEFENDRRFNFILLGNQRLKKLRKSFKLGVICSGPVWGSITEIIAELNVGHEIPVLKLGTLIPFPKFLVKQFVEKCEKVLVLEEPDSLIELLIGNDDKIIGRSNHYVPTEGELSPEIIESTLLKVLKVRGIKLPEKRTKPRKHMIFNIKERPPVLCPGCPHRASFYAIKCVFPNAIYSSDIGCYTLGKRQSAVDIVLNMGASIGIASGISNIYDGKNDVMVVVTIGDSTFYHSGIPALLNAVHTNKSFVVVVLDNQTTAMTGFQPTLASETLADDSKGKPLSLENIIQACGIEFLKVVDPYNLESMIAALWESRFYLEQRKSIPVVIARHQCVQLQRTEIRCKSRIEVKNKFDLLETEKSKYAPQFQTKIPPCNENCPIGIDIERILWFLAKGKHNEAIALLLKSNPLPAVCGRVCFHPCEEACNRRLFDEPVKIQWVERFLGDRATEDHLPRIAPFTGYRIAVVGSGPAGLSCAYALRLLGHKVEIFEAMAEPGGILRYGIPPYRLPKEVLRREIQRIMSLGITIHTGVSVGKDMPFERLLDFDAIFLATGAQKARCANIEGEGLKGVWNGLEVLKMINEGRRLSFGRRIVVIGGGNTAIDVSRSLKRLGYDPLLVYRRRKENMPAHPAEVEQAELEGVKMLFCFIPLEIIGEEKVTKIRLGKTALDREGEELHYIPGSEFEMEVDTVVMAIGEDPDFEIPSWFKENPKVFWGGDLVNVKRTVANAIASGMRVAQQIHDFLTCEKRIPPTKTIQLPVALKEIKTYMFSKLKATQAKRLPPHLATKSFNEIYSTISEEDALKEAKDRCFHCGNCTACDFCLVSCPNNAILKRTDKYEVDLNRCTLCRVCAEVCPRSVIDMPLVGSCVKCKHCINILSCPSLVFVNGKVYIDQDTCVGCNLCVYVCKQGAIQEVK